MPLCLVKRRNHRERRLFLPNFPHVLRLTLAGAALKGLEKGWWGGLEKVNVDPVPGLPLCFLVGDSVKMAFLPDTER